MSLNAVLLSGTLIGPPQLRTSRAGKPCVTLELLAGGTVPLSVTVWGRLGDTLRGLQAGARLIVQGSLSANEVRGERFVDVVASAVEVVL